MQYPESAFKVATFDRWIVFVSGRDTVEDIRKCPEEELSPWLGTLGVRVCLHIVNRHDGHAYIRRTTDSQALQLEYTCNHAVVFGYWQVNAATRLTQTVLPTILPEVIEEVALAARDYITTPEDGGMMDFLVSGEIITLLCCRLDQCRRYTDDTENRRSHQQPSIC